MHNFNEEKNTISSVKRSHDHSEEMEEQDEEKQTKVHISDDFTHQRVFAETEKEGCWFGTEVE